MIAAAKARHDRSTTTTPMRWRCWTGRWPKGCGMRMSTLDSPAPLGRDGTAVTGHAEELRAMRAAAWHKQGIVVVPLDDIYDSGTGRFCPASPPSSTVRERRPDRAHPWG